MKTKKEDRRKNRLEDPFYNVEKVASANECTGLMPSLPQNQDEDRALAELYSTHDEKPKQ